MVADRRASRSQPVNRHDPDVSMGTEHQCPATSYRTWRGGLVDPRARLNSTFTGALWVGGGALTDRGHHLPRPRPSHFRPRPGRQDRPRADQRHSPGSDAQVARILQCHGTAAPRIARMKIDCRTTYGLRDDRYHRPVRLTSRHVSAASREAGGTQGPANTRDPCYGTLESSLHARTTSRDRWRRLRYSARFSLRQPCRIDWGAMANASAGFSRSGGCAAADDASITAPSPRHGASATHVPTRAPHCTLSTRPVPP